MTKFEPLLSFRDEPIGFCKSGRQFVISFLNLRIYMKRKEPLGEIIQAMVKARNLKGIAAVHEKCMMDDKRIY